MYLCALFGCIDLNLITLILTIAILFGLTDFLTERFPRLQRDIYYIAFGVIAFLFVIRYYYGPDIWNYARFYALVGSPAEVLAHPEDIPFRYESGFALFCSVLKQWGLSFYWMTVVQTLLYLGAIGLVFSKIERKRSFALALLVVLDFNIIYIEYRQCLAVAAFLMMVLCMDRKKYLWTLLFAFLAIVFHKSGAIAVVSTVLYYLISTRHTQASLFQLILILLVLMFVLPVTQVSTAFLQHLPIPESVLSSVEHHVLLGKQVQIIFVLYVTLLLCLVHYMQYSKSRVQTIAAAAIIGLLLIAVFYQYYYLLNRLRSYFTPLIIVFLFRQVQEAEDKQVHVPYGAFAKQLACVIGLVYMLHTTYALHRSTQSMKHKVCETCTVFDLINHRPVDVQKSQMRKAELWWEEDFMSDETNRIH